MKVVTRRIVIVTLKQFYNNFDPIAREKSFFIQLFFLLFFLILDLLYKQNSTRSAGLHDMNI